MICKKRKKILILLHPNSIVVMRRLLIFILSLMPIVASAIGVENTVSLLDRLDSALAHSEEFASLRLARVASLAAFCSRLRTILSW